MKGAWLRSNPFQFARIEKKEENINRVAYASRPIQDSDVQNEFGIICELCE